MKNPLLRSFVSLILLGVFPASTLSAQNTQNKSSAVLEPHGNVTLDGKEEARSTPLVDGDKVQTASCSAAKITSPGSQAIVAADSLVTFESNELRLSDGTATVNTTTGMTSQVSQFLVAPAANGTAKYEIKKTGKAISVHAIKSGLSVTGDGKTVSVAEGNTESFNSPQEQDAAKKPWVPCVGFWIAVAGAGVTAAILIAALASNGSGGALSPSVP